ncbi:hypothetical protein QBC40DRAFT_279597 [Triangularia verruculosa]|uniref:Secreted protein n=1 Tax=Triangularia verruculosa TaxID=2587418 RepID=A0AAN7AX98_9PEZI|nr:hypothetical protein QBC40DRAFT_279597 [Triangularia verruculosa]
MPTAPDPRPNLSRFFFCLLFLKNSRASALLSSSLAALSRHPELLAGLTGGSSYEQSAKRRQESQRDGNQGHEKLIPTACRLR